MTTYKSGLEPEQPEGRLAVILISIVVLLLTIAFVYGFIKFLGDIIEWLFN